MAGVIGGVAGVAAPARFATALVRDIGRTGIGEGVLLNVNVPELPRRRSRGWR